MGRPPNNHCGSREEKREDEKEDEEDNRTPGRITCKLQVVVYN
jgi:hypothetical protein